MSAPSALRAELEAALGDRYRILGDNDRGGMAWVFRAEDRKHRRDVAIKVLRPEVGHVLGADRFEREIAIAARLNHPHIVPLFDSGTTGGGGTTDRVGLLYYVMPFIEGESLRDRLDRSSPLPLDEALRIARDAAAGLAYAHSHGVIHRDIKPENILLVGGAALVADFGIALPDGPTGARMTATGVTVGTLAYMSPEQMTGERALDSRTDVYSLGAVLYEMLAGSPPHQAKGMSELLARRLAGPPDDLATRIPGLPAAVADLLRRTLATDPAGRPASSEEVVQAIDAARTGPRPVARRHGRRWLWPVAAAALVIVAAIPVLRRAGFGSRGGDAPPAPELVAIAVMPFANLSADAANEYFSDGLGEELINALSRIEGLRVAPRTSSWTLKGRNVDVRTVGQSLAVGTVVEGSVRRSGDALRVTARLVRASDAHTLWSGTFDERHVTDVFAIQDSITRAIAENVLAQIAPGTVTAATPVIPPAETRSFEAHDLFLRGTFERNRRSPESIRRAIELFHQTLELDSTYARAWIGLAEAYAVAGFYDDLPPAEAFPSARQAAEAGLKLDPAAGPAHATLGYVALYHDWDLPRAEREFLRAIQLSPQYGTAHQWYANMLTAAGRFDEAREHWRHARDREPLAMIMIAAQGWTEFYAGRPELTVSLQYEALSRDSSFALAHYFLGLGLEAQGKHGDAIRAFRRSAALAGFGSLALTGVAHAHANAGRRDSALTVLRVLEQRSRREYVPPFEVAAVYVALGDNNRALTLLEQAKSERSHSIALANVDPRLRTLAGQPRFEAVRAAIRHK